MSQRNTLWSSSSRSAELVAAVHRSTVIVLLAALGAACGTIDPRPGAPAASSSAGSEELPALAPTLATQPVGDDPDDPAIWINAADPARSLVIGTNKMAAPSGAIVVFALDGTVRQTIPGVHRPNNVDVEYGFAVGGRSVDIAVATERLQHRLRVFAIDGRAGRIADLSSVPVLVGESGDRSEPMGIALYKRARDGTIFAIVAPKLGAAIDYLWQYRLEADAVGGVTGRLVRRFGHFSGKGAEPGEAGEIEAVVVDDELGFVYYADERYGIHKWHADPDHPDARRELAVFGREGYARDREGLAIYAESGGRGFIVSTDQVPGGSILRLYPREGRPGAPHDHGAPIASIRTSSDDTDGIEVVATPLPGFPAGLLVMMNSAPKNFLFYDWAPVRAVLGTRRYIEFTRRP